MERGRLVSLIIAIICFLVIILNFGNLTGYVVDNSGFGNIGPSEEEIECMQECVSVGCDAGDMLCMDANSHECGEKCGVPTEAPAPENDGEACMQKCVVRDCEEYDFSCQNKNKEKCEIECDMLGDAPNPDEMSAEEACISECVAKEDPTVICGNSEEGETGGSLCQKCADLCVHLYEGPCLDDEKLSAMEKECETCEHCYGEPVMGPSGQGWDCIVGVECNDASSEFGDEPGTGPGIEKVVEGIVGFFKGLFGTD